MTFLITYDLRGKRDYTTLYEKIKGLGDWMHYIESSWLVETRDQVPASQIFNTLKPYIDEGVDFLFVVEVTRDYYGILPKDAWEWLSQRDWQHQGLPV